MNTTKVKPGEHITYEMYPWGIDITAVVQFDTEHGNDTWIAQCTGAWQAFFEPDICDYVLLADIGLEIDLS